MVASISICLTYFNIFFITSCVGSRKQYLEDSNNNYRLHEKNKMIIKLNKTTILNTLQTSSYYNLDYYDCSKYPENKNISRPNIHNHLLMTISKFIKYNKMTKDVLFNVSTNGI